MNVVALLVLEECRFIAGPLHVMVIRQQYFVHNAQRISGMLGLELIYSQPFIMGMCS